MRHFWNFDFVRGAFWDGQSSSLSIQGTLIKFLWHSGKVDLFRGIFWGGRYSSIDILGRSI